MTQEDAEDMHRLALGGSSAVSGDASEPIMINGKPATALSLLDALIDIYKDQRDAPPESRCYVESAWSETVADAEKFLASQASPAKRGAEPSDPFREHLAQQAENIERAGLADALTMYGVSHAGDGQEGFAANLAENVNRLIRACRQYLAQSAPSEKLAGAEAVATWQDRAQRNDPDGNPKYWSIAFKAEFMEAEIRDLRAALASHAQTVPQVPAGQGQYFDAFLCRAWGETDLPTAEIVADLAGVRRFMVREWWGEENPTECGSNENMGDRIMGEIAERDWREEGDWSATFEIGGVSVERITGFASLQPEAAGAAQPSDQEIAQLACIVWGAQTKRLPLSAAIQFARAVLAARTPADAGGAKS